MKRISNSEYEEEKVFGHYFLQLSVENLRCFGERQTIKLCNEKGKPYHWTIIMGENGVGKTCLLRSFVALAPSPKSVFRDYQDIKHYPGFIDWKDQWDPRRQNGKAPTVIAGEVIAAYGFDEIFPNSQQKLEISKDHSKYNELETNGKAYEKLGDFLCFAYGASRKMGRLSFTSDKYSTASVSLFDDEAPLINVEEFFIQADYEAKISKSKIKTSERDKIKKLLLEILPEVEDMRISKDIVDKNRVVEMKTPYGWAQIKDMSLGYKSLIAWIVDFASRMYRYHSTKPNPLDQPAVVLIDEIDLHLHPQWQRKVLTYLSDKFPNTQFIATAHSPLIVQAALDANLILLKRNNDQVEINNNPDIIKNWRIDQILTSDLFGLSSSRSESTERIIKKRRELLLKTKLSSVEKKQLKDLEDELGPLPVAETPEYIEAMEIVKKASKEVK